MRYPADTEVDVGANDMSAHVQSTINGCPNTRVVLGGYSLGAAVTDVVMAAPGPMFGFTNPLPPGCRSAHRGDRAVRQRHPVGRADHEFQPGLHRPDHRLVPRHRPHLQPGRPAHLVRQLAAALWRTAISRTAWSIRPPTSSPASWRSQCAGSANRTHRSVSASH